MATGLKSSADIGFLLVGGRDVRSRTTVFTDVEEAVVEETSAFGDNTDSWAYVGQSMWTLDQEGFYDNAVGSMHEALAVTDAVPLMFAIGGNTIGDDFLGVSAARTTYTKIMTRGALHRAKASYHAADAGPDRGSIGAHHTARTAAGPTSETVLDMGAAYANQVTGKLVAYLGLSALTLDGGTGLQVKVRHCDTSGGTYADLITFTTVTVAPGAERKQVLATVTEVERYIKIQWEFLGGAGAARSATFAVGIARPLA